MNKKYMAWKHLNTQARHFGVHHNMEPNLVRTGTVFDPNLISSLRHLGSHKTELSKEHLPISNTENVVVPIYRNRPEFQRDLGVSTPTKNSRLVRRHCKGHLSPYPNINLGAAFGEKPVQQLDVVQVELQPFPLEVVTVEEEVLEPVGCV